ncbi:hypothetical protein IFHNHDMJ_01365 [Synechococcus sp. CBW1107]|nr:hypothetical protein IFHNHDMJ_01365 [Synechococcus sp. CBW1107]
MNCHERSVAMCTQLIPRRIAGSFPDRTTAAPASLNRLGLPVCRNGLALLTLLFSLAPSIPALAQSQQQSWNQPYGMSRQEKDLLDYGPGSGRGDSILDTTNPLDLMNKIRKGTAMDNATPPGDAVDQALRDFDAQQRPPTSGASQMVTSP